MYCIAETPLCEADKIIVHDGPSASSPPFGKFCQQGSTVTITSTSNHLFVIFWSINGTRQSENIKGFEATFREGKMLKKYIKVAINKATLNFYIGILNYSYYYTVCDIRLFCCCRFSCIFILLSPDSLRR